MTCCSIIWNTTFCVCWYVRTCAACGSSPQVHSISGLSLLWLVISESLFGVDERESSRLLGECHMLNLGSGIWTSVYFIIEQLTESALKILQTFRMKNFRKICLLYTVWCSFISALFYFQHSERLKLVVIPNRRRKVRGLLRTGDGQTTGLGNGESLLYDMTTGGQTDK